MTNFLVNKEVFYCKEIMELVKVVDLIKIVSDIGLCYENLIKEFIVNSSIEYNVKGSEEYKKVYVGRKCVKFSPSIINDYLNKIFTL